jgi:hypothetical protein
MEAVAILYGEMPRRGLIHILAGTKIEAREMMIKNA